jgi:hypothetical protein
MAPMSNYLAAVHVTFSFPLRICGIGLLSLEVSPFAQINLEQEVLGRINGVLSFDMTRTAEKTKKLGGGYTDSKVIS